MFFVGGVQAVVVELPKKYAVKICFFDFLVWCSGSLSRIVLASPLATQISSTSRLKVETACLG